MYIRVNIFTFGKCISGFLESKNVLIKVSYFVDAFRSAYSIIHTFIFN